MQQVLVPDMGTTAEVSVIEILVKPGDSVAKDASLITLESDKASMEVPSPYAGIIKDIAVKVGDKLQQGKLILTLDTAEEKTQSSAESKTQATETAKTTESKTTETAQVVNVTVPDLGGAKEVTVIEIEVKVGNDIEKETALVSLESDKASMELPSPYSGKVKEIKVKVGDKVAEGAVILTVETAGELLLTDAEKTAPVAAAKTETNTATVSSEKIVATASSEITSNENKSETTATTHAGPSVRRFARELGVDLNQVKGSGRKDRILIEDVQAYVKNAMQNKTEGTGINVASAPVIDFSKFGMNETKPLSRIKKLTGINVHRSWVTVPHVTQFDEADITEMEAFRNAHKEEADKLGFKLTPIIFLMKAVVAALKQFPIFNASLDASGDNLILKKYFHIGVAVDTPNGLVVPVIRDVDQKGLYQLADELAKISKKAREKGLMPADMQGSCFTISSLGGIGGTAFTPIVNTPDVAILGVSKASMKPIYQNGEFVARLMLPLSLSYDHRVIDGADGARFTTYLSKILSDVRQLLF